MTPLGQRLARAMYALLLRLALPLYLARLWRRGAREPEYRRAWGERLGWYGARVAPGALWVHAVSLGETRAAAALVDALREREPGCAFCSPMAPRPAGRPGGRCCATVTCRPGCPTTPRVRRGASCGTTGRGWAC